MARTFTVLLTMVLSWGLTAGQLRVLRERKQRREFWVTSAVLIVGWMGAVAVALGYRLSLVRIIMNWFWLP